MQTMATNDNTSDDNIFDKKKKKKSKNRINRDAIPEVTAITDSSDTMAEDRTTNDKINEDGDFTYEYLITRIFDQIRKTNPKDPDHRIRIILPPLQLGRIGTRRTSLTNFGLLCKLLKRHEKILCGYFVVELGTTASIDANHALIIKGRLGQSQIERILCSFIKEYVSCKTCHSPDTLLKKEERLTVIKCNTCQSQYSVSNIKTGFQAQIGKRSKAT